MAFTHVGNLGTALSTAANQASLVLTTTATAARRSLVVVLIAVDNNQTTDGDATHVSGVTDSVGNTYTRGKEFANGQGTAQTGAEIAIFYSHLETILPAGGTITATYNPAATADASAMTAKNFSLLPNAAVAINGTPGGLANDAAAAGSLNVTTSNAPMLRVRGIASESNSTTALTPTATWAIFAQAISGAGTSATEMGVRGEWVISTGTSAASAPTGGAGAVDHASAYVAFQENQTLISPKFDWYQGDWPEKRKLVRDTLRTLSTAVLASAIAILPPQPAPAGSLTQLGAIGNPGTLRPQFNVLVRSSRVHMRDGIASAPNMGSVPPLSISGAFVSSWSGPTFSRKIIFQSVAKPVGLPVANPVILPDLINAWRLPPSPLVKHAKTYLREGFVQPIFVAAAPGTTEFAGAWDAEFHPAVRRATRATALREGIVRPLSPPTAPATETSIAAFGWIWANPPLGRFVRVHMRDGAAYTVGQTASAAAPASSGAFVSPWGGPTVSRQFQYQAKVHPLAPAPTASVAPSTGWFSSYSLPASGGYSVVEDIYGFVVPDPFSFAWFDNWAPPPRRKNSFVLIKAMSYATGQTASSPPTASDGAFVSNWAGPVLSRQFQYQAKVGVPRDFGAAVAAPSFGWYTAFQRAPIKRSKPWFNEGVSWDPRPIVAAEAFVSFGWYANFKVAPTKRAKPWFLEGVTRSVRHPDFVVDTAPPYGWYVAFDWTERRARSRARLAQLYPSIAHAHGHQDEVVVPPVGDERNTGAWLSQAQVDALHRKQARERQREERRFQEKLRTERALQRTIERAYAKAIGKPLEDDEKPFVEILKPYVKAQEAKGPELPPLVIDWRALTDNLELIRQLLFEIERLELLRQQQADEDEMIMVLLLSL